MVNSIAYFEENCIKELEKLEEDFIKNPTRLSEYITGVNEVMHRLGERTVQEALETLDQLIQGSYLRKRDWVVETHSKKCMITSLGDVTFRKTLFTNKETGKSEYLLDKIVGFEENQRMTDDAEARMLKEAAQTSYRRGGMEVSETTEVKKQTVKNKIHALKFPEEEKPAIKKEVDYLYIEADEDHVSLQFNERKGDLEKSANGRKNNTLITKLVYVHEGIEPEAPKSDRHRLINPHYFCSTNYECSNEEFWDRIYRYIDDHYDTDKIKRIYLNADGGTWIKAGMKKIDGMVYALDGFHLEKYLMKLVGHTGEDKEKNAAALRSIMRNGTKKQFKEAVAQLKESLVDGASERKIDEAEGYILSNWAAAKTRLNHKDGVKGSSTEGHVSHVLSERMSSRPMGWSETGATKMAQLRAYDLNDGDMLKLVRYQKKEETKVISDEYKILSSTEILTSERNRHAEVGKYMESISHSLTSNALKEFWLRDFMRDMDIFK